MRYVKAFICIALLGLITTITACIDESDADSSADGITEAQVKQLIADAVAPLETRIAELEATQSGLTGNVLRAPSLARSTKPGLRKPGTDVTTICSTLLYSPGGFPGAMEKVACRSSTGYLVQIPITTTTETVRPAPLASQRVFFENADCTGQPYVHKDNVGEFGLSQGAVFSIYNGTLQTVYVPAGTGWAPTNAPYGWEPDGSGGFTCENIGSTGLYAVPVQPNDAQITGIADTYVGPIIY